MQLSHPDDKKHNVLDPCVFFEIHVMDEVMLKLMEETSKDSYDDNTQDTSSITLAVCKVQGPNPGYAN